MPTFLPTKSVTKKRRDSEAFDDFIGIWAVSLGAAAAVFALFVYFGDCDQIASTFILCAAAFLICLARIVAGSEKTGN